jgi:hypothetical protein
MEKPTINQIISLGPACPIAEFLKNFKLRNCSYPFDWMYSSPKLILDCLNDDFNILLNKEYHTNCSENISGHSLYGNKIFRHKNILNENDYLYYIRCVQRFRFILSVSNLKLFTVISNFNDRTNEISQIDNNIIVLNDKLKLCTKNFFILNIVFHISKSVQKYDVNIKDNIYHCDIWIFNHFTGSLNKHNRKDTLFFMSILKQLFNIEIHNFFL